MQASVRDRGRGRDSEPPQPSAPPGVTVGETLDGVAAGGATSEAAALRAMSVALHRRFDTTMTAARVDLEIERALAEYARAPIRTYLPILVEREVAGRLRSDRCDR